ncbi:L-serine ammonia-lyase, iron-sulfur-dependent subunit beta [Paenibacillus nasutitermitis]|uniref:L-serine deaminase n=1 Tax=Paenibacillus nasutitermitis TaxID=1652958 RepID=A0A916YXJ3_9BACL|nr:L-serine ammonia-lyase, iron-sulfur-dependent subunit beta [Paenibacillus nasutitermitis]GGD65993.1 L-serine dehydratase, iron-sulfur-dependent subunit beta [Paenibacillus nasutitermitis]
MRFKDVFSIIGPGMIGPSSSHTAGAARLGQVARRLLGAPPVQAEITLYGSFAETYRGHGTDLAIVGGLLDFSTDDSRIRHSLALAESQGMQIIFRTGIQQAHHPNTAEIVMNNGSREDRLTGTSIGGGNIEIIAVNGFDVRFSAHHPTLLIFHADRPGMLADITSVMKSHRLNICYMDVDRKSRSGDALTVLETDESISPEMVHRLLALDDVGRVSLVDLDKEERETP